MLGFLLANPGKVISVDLNPLQNYLLELKIAAFRHLSHNELQELFGVSPSSAPARLYAAVRDDLSAEARQYWDAHREWIGHDLLVRGGFEQYFALLRKMTRLTVGQRKMEKLFELPLMEQREFYNEEWNTRRWRAMIGIGCSKWLLGRKLDPSWFADSEVRSFGAHFARLGEHAIAEIPARTNYFLAQIFLGRYVDLQEVPEYLKEENFLTIRERVERISIVTADIADALAGLPDHSVDCFALSNVFEYSPVAVFERSRNELVRSARRGARLSLRNLLAPRRLAADARFSVDEDASELLRQRDRGFIYSRFEAATMRE